MERQREPLRNPTPSKATTTRAMVPSCDPWGVCRRQLKRSAGNGHQTVQPLREALHGVGKQSALIAADTHLTELAALLLPSIAYVMGEELDALGEDGEVDCPCGERHPCE